MLFIWYLQVSCSVSSSQNANQRTSLRWTLSKIPFMDPIFLHFAAHYPWLPVKLFHGSSADASSLWIPLFKVNTYLLLSRYRSEFWLFPEKSKPLSSSKHQEKVAPEHKTISFNYHGILSQLFWSSGSQSGVILPPEDIQWYPDIFLIVTTRRGRVLPH